MGHISKFLTLTWVLGTFSIALSAQNYLPASVTYHSGKTQEGQVFYGNWGETPQSIKFRDRQGKEFRLSINEIKSFEVARKDGKKEYYVLKTVLVNQSSRKMSDLDFGPEPKMVLQTVFLQLQLEGDLKLYSLSQSGLNHLFVENDSLFELVQKLFRTEVGGEQQYSENNRYRQQLLALTQSVPSLKERILKLPYTENAIRRLLSDFLSRKGTVPRYKFTHEDRLLDVYFSLGLVNNKFAYLGITGYADMLETFTYARTNTLTPAVGAILYFPKTHKRIAAVVDFSIRNIRDSIVYNPNYRPYINREAIESQYYRLTHLRINTGPRLQLSKNGIRFYIQPGVTFGRVIANKSRETARVRVTTTFQTIERPLFTQVKKQEFGVAFAAGFGYKRWSIEARYDKGNGFSPYFDTAIETNNYSVFLHYRL